MISPIPAPGTAPALDLLAMTQKYLAQHEERLAPDNHLRVAWEQFYEIYRRKIRAYAFSCGVVDADVVDCEQEVWRELLVRLPTFEIDVHRGQFDSWLFSIVRSKAIDQFRAKNARQSQQSNEHLAVLSDQRADPAINFEAEEVFSLAMDRLRERVSDCSFHILRMRLVEQRSVAEVAKKVGLTHEQVWYRYHRARKDLEAICAALCEDKRLLKKNNTGSEKETTWQKAAQGKPSISVPRGRGPSPLLFRGGSRVDYVFKKVELGRRTLNQEWKVEWTCDAPPTAVLLIRKLSIVAYAEICGLEEILNHHWPRIANAAMAAGVAAGIATIVATPTAALPIFRSEFQKHLHGKAGGELGESVCVALSAVQEPNGPWCECKD